MVQSNIDLLAQILINNTYNNYDYNDNNNYSNVNTITKLINSTVLSLLLSPPSSLSSSKTSINPNDDPQQQYRHPNTYRSLINESFINYNNDNFAQNSLKNGDFKHFNPLNMYPNDDIDNDTNMIINKTILLSSKLMPSILEPSSLLSSSASSASEASISSTTSATTIVDKLYLHHILIALILTLIILSTVIGNLLVIAAIIIEKNLRSVGNYLVFSLAFADLMVALFVMPFGAIIVVKGKWLLGANICDLWTIADVLCCTASILHLLAIALDRYWAVTNVDYIHKRRNGHRIGLMIIIIWFISIIISLAPIFGWRDKQFYERIANQQCLISQDVYYQIIATCLCFYLPLLLILLLYWQIFKVARKRIRHKPGSKISLVQLKSMKTLQTVNKTMNKIDDNISNISNNDSNNNTNNMNINLINNKKSAKILSIKSGSSIRTNKDTNIINNHNDMDKITHKDNNKLFNDITNSSMTNEMTNSQPILSDITSSNNINAKQLIINDICIDDRNNDDDRGQNRSYSMNIVEQNTALTIIERSPNDTIDSTINDNHHSSISTYQQQSSKMQSKHSISDDDIDRIDAKDMINSRAENVRKNQVFNATTINVDVDQEGSYLPLNNSSITQPLIHRHKRELSFDDHYYDHQQQRNQRKQWSKHRSQALKRNSSLKLMRKSIESKHSYHPNHDHYQHTIIEDDDDDDIDNNYNRYNYHFSIDYGDDYSRNSTNTDIGHIINDNIKNNIMTSMLNRTLKSLVSFNDDDYDNNNLFNIENTDNDNHQRIDDNYNHYKCDMQGNHTNNDDKGIDRNSSINTDHNTDLNSTIEQSNYSFSDDTNSRISLLNDANAMIVVDINDRQNSRNDYRSGKQRLQQQQQSQQLDHSWPKCSNLKNSGEKTDQIDSNNDIDTLNHNHQQSRLQCKYLSMNYDDDHDHHQQQQQNIDESINIDNDNDINDGNKLKPRILITNNANNDNNGNDGHRSSNTNDVNDNCHDGQIMINKIDLLLTNTDNDNGQSLNNNVSNNINVINDNANGHNDRNDNGHNKTNYNRIIVNHQSNAKQSMLLSQNSPSQNPTQQHQSQQQQSYYHQKESVESKRERKAAKTLAIITGVFVICWLPFFINALLSPLSKQYQDFMPNFLIDFFQWLGYINSCVNPIIYTIFSPDFRMAFKRMLLGKKRLRKASNKTSNKLKQGTNQQKQQLLQPSSSSSGTASGCCSWSSKTISKV